MLDHEPISVELEEDIITRVVGRHTHPDNDQPSTLEHGAKTNIEAPSSTQHVHPPSPSPPPLNKFHSTIVPFSLCTAIFLAALDSTIITTALPTIARHFHSSAAYTWIGSAYLLTSAACVPSWGKLSDIWGRKKILLITIAFIFGGSLLAALSTSIQMLIAARCVQGIGGGGVLNIVTICFCDLYSLRRRGKYFGMMGLSWLAASTLGPVVGGGLTERLSWRWCFWINCEIEHVGDQAGLTDLLVVPIAGAVFVALAVYLKLENEKTGVIEGLKALDWLGTLTSVGGTLMLLIALELGGVFYPWTSVKILCLVIFGILLFGIFILVEAYAEYPLMPLHIFKRRSNVGALAVVFFQSYCFTGGLFYLPIYFQAILGASPLLSGIYLLPFGISSSLIEAITGISIQVTGKYLPWIWAGLILMTIGFGLFVDLGINTNWSKIILYQLIAGIGIGSNYQPPALALQSQLIQEDVATASATMGFIRLLSQAISVVIGGTIFSNQMEKAIKTTLNAELGQEVAAQLKGTNLGASVEVIKTLTPMQQVYAKSAFWDSLKDMFVMYVCFAGVGVLVGFMVRGYKLDSGHEVTTTGLKTAKERRAKQKREKEG